MNSQGSIFSAYAGHAVDLMRLIAFRPRNPHSYSKLRNILAVAKRGQARQFIEAGTYLGNTSKRAARHFDHVYTVELDPVLAAKAAQYLATSKNVEAILGDALVEVPSILSRPTVRNALVFLDGHYSGPGTALGPLREPACEVIDRIAEHVDKISAVVVDDFRCFGTEEGWPSKGALLTTLEKTFGRRFAISVHLDQVLIVRHAWSTAQMGITAR